MTTPKVLAIGLVLIVLLLFFGLFKVGCPDLPTRDPYTGLVTGNPPGCNLQVAPRLH